MHLTTMIWSIGEGDLVSFSKEINKLSTETGFESLYGGQFTLSTQLMKPNYLVILPTDAAPLFR